MYGDRAVWYISGYSALTDVFIASSNSSKRRRLQIYPLTMCTQTLNECSLDTIIKIIENGKQSPDTHYLLLK